MAIKSSDQISIIDVTDAYSVVLTSDAYTFPGTTNAAKPGSCTTQIIAMRGAEQIPASVTLGSVTAPTGVTVTKNADATAPTLTITVTPQFVAAGTVKIPVLLEDGTITIQKNFAVSIAYTGQQGQQGPQGSTGNGVSKITTTYQASASNTTAPTGTWQNTPPSVPAGQYLWTKMVLTYTNNTTSDPIYSVAKQGATGAKGEDAITMSVTSSAGTIFKNSAIVTTLTAHVYKAGVEVTGSALTALGAIKWYKDGGTTAVATGQTLTISAGDVTGKASYIAQLEG